MGNSWEQEPNFAWSKDGWSLSPTHQAKRGGNGKFGGKATCARSCCLFLEGPNTKRLQRKERGDPLPGLQNPPGAGCCHQLGPPLSPCSPKIEKLAQQRVFLRLCHLTGTLKAGKIRRNVPPLHPRALWGVLLQAHSWRDEHVWPLPQLCSGTQPHGDTGLGTGQNGHSGAKLAGLRQGAYGRDPPVTVGINSPKNLLHGQTNSCFHTPPPCFLASSPAVLAAGSPLKPCRSSWMGQPSPPILLQPPQQQQQAPGVCASPSQRADGSCSFWSWAFPPKAEMLQPLLGSQAA